LEQTPHRKEQAQKTRTLLNVSVVKPTLETCAGVRPWNFKFNSVEDNQKNQNGSYLYGTGCNH